MYAARVAITTVQSFVYDDCSRLSNMTIAGVVVNYRCNALELQAYETGPTALIPTGAACYVYDEAGKLLGEYGANGNPVYETVYLGASLVGIVKTSGTAAAACGSTAADQNPNSLGVFNFNQRLPGQVFDAKTGLFQSWHREYNARIGRYMQSDSIGLKG